MFPNQYHRLAEEGTQLTCSHPEAVPSALGTRSLSSSHLEPTRVRGLRSYQNQRVRIACLSLDSSSLAGLRFENCEIVGPAVIADLSDVRLSRCTLEDSCAIEVVDRSLVGALRVRRCEFVHCSFADIGFALPPASARWVRACVAFRNHH
jgi:hypothetical protein